MCKNSQEAGFQTYWSSCSSSSDSSSFFIPSLSHVKCAAQWCFSTSHWAAALVQSCYCLHKSVTCRSGERRQMDTQAAWMASLIKSSQFSWPCAAKRTLFWHWQFLQQDWAPIHHPWQVKQCAQSVYIHNYKASLCSWAERVQEHLLVAVSGEVYRLHVW